jgi:hypothetical protein
MPLGEALSNSYYSYSMHSSIASECIVVFYDVYYLGECVGALICSLLSDLSSYAVTKRAFSSAFVLSIIYGSVTLSTGYNSPIVLDRYLPGKVEFSSSYVLIETILNL